MSSIVLFSNSLTSSITVEEFGRCLSSINPITARIKCVVNAQNSGKLCGDEIKRARPIRYRNISSRDIQNRRL